MGVHGWCIRGVSIRTTLRGVTYLVVGGGGGVAVERPHPVLRGADAAHARPTEPEHARAPLTARRTLQSAVTGHAQIVSHAAEHTPVQTHATLRRGCS